MPEPTRQMRPCCTLNATLFTCLRATILCPTPGDSGCVLWWGALQAGCWVRQRECDAPQTDISLAAMHASSPRPPTDRRGRLWMRRAGIVTEGVNSRRYTESTAPPTTPHLAAHACEASGGHSARRRPRTRVRRHAKARRQAAGGRHRGRLLPWMPLDRRGASLESTLYCRGQW